MQNNRRSFLSATALLALGALAPQVRAQTQGKDYLLLPQQHPKDDPKKIEVIEFFSYGCGHCNDFHPLLKAWVAKQPADVAFRRVPVVWNAAWANLARLFYALEATGDLARLDDQVFAALHAQRLRLYDEKSMSEWYVKQGGDARKFSDAFNAFTTMSKLKQAEQLGKAMRIDSVPALVVEGKYLVQGGNFQQLLANTDALVATSRKK
ncbi:thiol:disulfide interchange protein DsbA/DsbL [Azovibrio restrictus]|uniref:thiol:disulfide interchange protein DsbA/DsbL n=1 Tax=Azovibrio restrictus TaxID=146938 RepID=UPI00040A26B0|nr:thiol:disulfide interchange protein DsbA/DsbL [Azovibrio restrictus]MCE1171664.1 thiol:disulfide interchange protein DsbA/DsbL [Azovibrio sp.]